MDELNDFFKDLNAPRIQLHAPATSGFRVLEKENIQTYNLAPNRAQKTEEDDSTDYAQEFRQRDEEEYLEEPVNFNRMDRMESLSSMGDLQSQEQLVSLSETDLPASYRNYTLRRPFDEPNLPIKTVKDKVLLSVKTNSVVIIEAATGCGKTTQVPQWILDDCYEHRRHCRIAVTQPRRIAAISIAKRVAQERGWEVGGAVGYQVGLDSKLTEDTKLQYMTTGILLQKLVAAKNMNMYTHIILDEIHERGQEMDFLLLVVKKFLRKNSRGVKVLLMSATFDSDKFRNYFDVASTPGLKGTDYIDVDAKEPFTNTVYYLDQLKQFRNLPNATIEEPAVTPQGYELVLRLLAQFERIDAVEDKHENNKVPPSVLVFLPGINEIEELANYLEDPQYRKKILEHECKLLWHVVPLHSTITGHEQAKAFLSPPEGYRKVILATNIAESSITVPDIKYVIDFCLMKVLVSDPDTHFTSLQTQWASRDNCRQRAGRAGRVRVGRVYRLVTKAMYKSQFEESCTPEMERCPLERLVLLAKLLDMGPPKEVLALAMNPPKLGNIRTTVLVLKEVGGLLKTLNGTMSYEDGDITYLGRIMAKLPVDIRVAKLIVLGHIFGVLHPTIVMGAAMTVKNVFKTPFRERLQAYNSKLTWADGSRSDCIAFYNLYRVWNAKVRAGVITRQNERVWARDMFAEVRALKELDDMVRELSLRLSRLGVAAVKNSKPAWSQAETPLILKVLITGAFYPHYFVQSAGDECREKEAIKTLGGLDPCNTVFLKDFPSNQPEQLYTAAIKKAVKKLIVDEPQVTFCTNSRKVYLTFNNAGEMNENKSCRMPGRVALPVYKAVKVRQLNIDIVIPSVPAERARALAQELSEQQQPLPLALRLPEITDSFLMLFISHVIDPGHFWIHNETDIGELRAIENILNKPELLCLTNEVEPGCVCVAPFKEANGTVVNSRCVVQQLMPSNTAWVFYMDYGNYGKVSLSSLREVPEGPCTILKPLAMECVLTGVGPSLCKGDTIWSDEALRFFCHHTMGQKLLGKIYSVSHGVISLELRSVDGKICINAEMIERNYARRTEESYDSKMNHDLRETAQDMSQRQVQALTEQQAQLAPRALRRAAAVPACELTHTIRLKGPYSPLESTLQNLMFGGTGKTVRIEWNSVNSVLLDTEPQEPYQRLVVAAQIGQNAEGSTLTLRHTTMMPNIAGLPAIMAMLFAPSVELRCDEAHSRYAAALCGLGAHHTDRGLSVIFPDHDVLLDFDVEITDADLEDINHLRFLMNQMMWCAPGQDEPSVPPELAEQAPAEARRDIIALLLRRRKHREFVAVNAPRRWTMSTVAPAGSGEEVRGAVFPQHATLRLQLEAQEDIKRKLAQDKLFRDMIKRNITDRCRSEVICSLCGVGPMDLVMLRIHLYSRIHCERVEELSAKMIASD